MLFGALNEVNNDVNTFCPIPSFIPQAVIATAIITAALTIYAWQTKIDFTAMGGALLCGLLCLILFGIWTAIFPSQVAQTAYAALAAGLFSLFIVYDTQQIIGGKHHSHKFEIDEYVFAALTLYIDIIQLFLQLLKLFGNRNN